MQNKTLRTLCVFFALQLFAFGAAVNAPTDETHNGWLFHSVLWPGMTINLPDGTSKILVGTDLNFSPYCSPSGNQCMVSVAFSDGTLATLRVFPYANTAPQWVFGEESPQAISVADDGSALAQLQTSEPSGVYLIGADNSLTPFVLIGANLNNVGTVSYVLWQAFTANKGILLGGIIGGNNNNIIYQEAGATNWQILSSYTQQYSLGLAYLQDPFLNVTPSGRMYGGVQMPYHGNYMPGMMDMDGTVTLFANSPTFALNPPDGNLYSIGTIGFTATGLQQATGPGMMGASDSDGLTVLATIVSSGPNQGKYVILNCGSGRGCQVAVPNVVPGFAGSTLSDNSALSNRYEIPGVVTVDTLELNPTVPYPQGNSLWNRNVYITDLQGHFTRVIGYNDFALFGNDQDLFRSAGHSTILSANSLVTNYSVAGSINGAKQYVTYLVLATKIGCSVANGASFEPSQPVSPGTTLFTTYCSVPIGTPAVANSYPLPTSLGGANVSFCGVSAPLLGNYGYVTTNPPLWQINGQVPSEIAGQTSCPVVISDQEGHTGQATVAVSSDPNTALALFPLYVTNSKGLSAIDPIITNQAGQLIVQPGDTVAGLSASSMTQAIPGEWLTFWGTGCGSVNSLPQDGMPAGFRPLSQSSTPLEVSIAGQPSTVEFSGLAPGYVGLCQVNVQVPFGATNGIWPLNFGAPDDVGQAYYLPIQTQQQ